ncbi:hypothetical protein HGT73_08625 [Rosenbergiella australiborealis]|uniref:Secreted protein n=1 Tax=Rosenbergiella australiborealis TaxID=1544696 RepID=A0ABS5T516_9GAMM|nr:hypothetical protein [Rosenbergiella australiborealis]MBT0727450.1 hypothetical protein [Rosenbergiella australiborealis]
MAYSSAHRFASIRLRALLLSLAVKCSGTTNGKKACLLLSPCFTALVFPIGAPDPLRFPPQLDCWLIVMAGLVYVVCGTH